MKTPLRFDMGDWKSYLFDAIKRENQIDWDPSTRDLAVALRRIKEGIRDGTDPYEMALAIDVFAIEFYDRTRDYHIPQLFALGSLLHCIYNQGPVPINWWRAMWFSRYADGEPEIDWFNTNMNGLSHARDTYNTDLENSYRHKLDNGMTRIQERGGTKGGRMFQLHLPRLLLAEEL